MRRRVFPSMVLSFLAGMVVAYGLVYLDRQAKIPRLKSTEVFEVVTRDGTVDRLSYADIERERQELSRIRARLRELERIAPHGAARGPLGRPAGQAARWPRTEETRAREEPSAPGEPPGAVLGSGGAEKLKTLFARIFSQPLMKELLQAQTRRRVGELAAVLDLTEEQKQGLEEALKQGTRAIQGEASQTGTQDQVRPSRRSLDEALAEILSPEQYERYQEYTEKKKALSQAPLLDKEVFELTWRLGLSEEQQAPVREILEEQAEKLRGLPFSPGSGTEGATGPRLPKHLEERLALEKETAERLKSVLEEDQYRAFLEYQEEKDAQTRLLRRLLEQEAAKGSPTPRP